MSCTAGDECDDGNPCTIDDTCNDSGSCLGTPYSCDDGKECTEGICLGDGECDYAINPGYCLISGLCYTEGDFHPKNGCRECITSVSKVEWSNDDTNECQDGDACMDGDYCDSGDCLAGTTPVKCDDENPCTDNTCEPAEGCVFVPHDLECDDENACTEDDSCATGECAGTEVSCDDDNLCTDDSCDSETGCINEPNTEICNDNDECTWGDTCTDGECIGEAAVCDDDDACNGVETCDPETGCVDGEPLVCDDANVCNGIETCDPVEGCLNSAPLECDDVNPCTDDSCNPLTGCANDPNTDPCTDDDVCTLSDTCLNGNCHGTPLDCADGNPCTEDLCDAATGCYYENTSGDCSDADVCTVGDFCANGECSSGPEFVDCDDENLCTTDSCDPIDGCVHVNNNELCDDNDACTVGDVCQEGACSSGVEALPCDDENECTSDVCNAETGCINEPAPGSCNDKNACTVGDSCLNGVCQTGAQALDCDDADVCTDDSCAPAKGCQHVFNTAPCSDGNECTDNDTCALGQCEGDVLVCKDDNECTNDSCNPFIQGGCVYTPNDYQCDDGDPCTLGDQCSGGDCMSGFGKLVCDDGKECTDNVCTPGVGCEYPNKVSLCDDGNACTDGDYCANGDCVSGGNVCGCNNDDDCDEWVDPNDKCKGKLHCDTDGFPYSCKVEPGTPVMCNANLNTECSIQACVPATGLCQAKAVNEGNPCDDDDPCTDSDICVAGECAGFDIPGCGIGLPCAEDDDCIDGLTCLTNMPGGYCVQDQCNVKGCPDGTSCWNFNDGAFHLCLVDCDANGDCREDESYVCDSYDTCWCGESICEPGEAVCNGDIATFCDACGSGYVDGGVNCAIQGKECAGGECIFPADCNSLIFDGGDVVTVNPHTWSGSLSEFTVEAWISSITSNQQAYARLIARTVDCGAGNSSFSLYVEPGSTEVRLFVCTDPGSASIGISGALPDGFWNGDWHHIAATWSSGGMARVFIDGKLAGETTAKSGTIKKPGLPLHIGGMPGFQQYFKGKIGGVRLSSSVRYNGNFTPQNELEADAQSMDVWEFTTGQGSVAYEGSDNGHDGTINGATWSDDGPACSEGGVCGDGVKASWEQCDDGNNDGGDGCTSDCYLECPGDGVDLTRFEYVHFGNGTHGPYFADQSYLSHSSDPVYGDWGWHNSAISPVPNYAAILFPKPTRITKFRLLLHPHEPKNSFFQGSNNSTNGLDGDWTTLKGPLSIPHNWGLKWWDTQVPNDSKFLMYRLFSEDSSGYAVYRWDMYCIP